MNAYLQGSGRMRIGSLFSGYGGLDLGVQAAIGGTVAWHCDNDPGASRILAHRYPDTPNLGDITAVDWTQVEPVDVLTGGFPCQPVSHAGKRLGDRDERWLWDDFARAIGALRPGLVVLENVRGLLTHAGGRLFGRVLGSLVDLGYDADWHCLRAADVGAPHGRFRVFVVAHPVSAGLEGAEPARGHVVPAWGSAADTGSEAVGLGTGLRPGEPGGVRGRRPDHDAAPAPTDATGDRRGQGWPEPARVVGGLDAAQCGAPAWGDYAPAIARWEHTLGRPAPAPTEPGRNGAPRLSARFVEHMMGLPDGWVTDVPDLTRNAQLKALGNGVVPAQAEAALRHLLAEAT